MCAISSNSSTRLTTRRSRLPATSTRRNRSICSINILVLFRPGPAVDKSFSPAQPITSEQRATVTDTVQLAASFGGMAHPASVQAGRCRRDLFMQILGGGNASRLLPQSWFTKSKSRKRVDCDNQSLKLTSIASCDVTARPGVKPEDLEAAVNEQVERCGETDQRRRNSIGHAT